MARFDRAVAQNAKVELTVERAHVLADTANLGVFPTRLLRKPVANLREHRFEIENALDSLFSGH